MDADLDTLATALYVKTDDLLRSAGNTPVQAPLPEPDRPQPPPVQGVSEKAQMRVIDRHGPSERMADPVSKLLGWRGHATVPNP